MVALKRRYRPTHASWTLQLEPGEKVFQIRHREERMDIQRGTPWEADTRVSGPEMAFPGLFYRGLDPDEMLNSGALSLHGPKEAWLGFLHAFGLGAKE